MKKTENDQEKAARNFAKIQGTTMWYCEECGEARSGRDHECDPHVRHEYCVNLRLKCEDLNAKCLELAEDWAKAAADRDEARERRGKLEEWKNDWQKMRQERDGLSLLRDHLEEEIGKFRARCDELANDNHELKMRRNEYQGSASSWESTSKQAEAERDEARQWAREFLAQYRDMKELRNFWRTIAKQVDGLRAQRASAKNDALEEAAKASYQVLYDAKVWPYIRMASNNAITALKS